MCVRACVCVGVVASWRGGAFKVACRRQMSLNGAFGTRGARSAATSVPWPRVCRRWDGTTDGERGGHFHVNGDFHGDSAVCVFVGCVRRAARSGESSGVVHAVCPSLSAVLVNAVTRSADIRVNDVCVCVCARPSAPGV